MVEIRVDARERLEHALVGSQLFVGERLILIDGAQQGRDRDLAFPVDLDREDVLVRGLELEPCASAGDQLCGAELSAGGRVARKREIEEKRRILFPIRLVDFETIKQWECFDSESGRDLAIEVREFFIPDFSNWKEPDEFENAVMRLIRDLRAGGTVARPDAERVRRPLDGLEE